MKSRYLISLACRIVPSVLLTLPLAAAGAEEKQAVKPVKIDIAPQSLSTALQAFSQQSGLQVGFASGIAKGVHSRGARDAKSITQALDALLDGTGLEYQFINNQTVVIKVKGTALTGYTHADDAVFVSQDGNDVARVLLAQVDSAADAAEAKKGGKSSTGVEEMVVEGSREKPAPFSTANLDLTRTENDVLPFTVFTARDIDLSGASTLQEFFNRRLPQNFGSNIMDEKGVDVGWGGANEVDMRGWGAKETVFLLNGRRMALQYRSYGRDSDNATPNLAGIPLGAIERIEVLSSAGSAIYGAAATGGVINIITRQDFKGGQVNLSYTTPADVNAPTRSVGVSYGVPFYWNTSLRLTGSYNEATPLTLGDRAAVSIDRWTRNVIAKDPERVMSRTAYMPAGATGNIRTVNTNATDNLFGPGTSNFTSVPNGYTGTGGLSAFQPGVYNLQLAENSGQGDYYGKDGLLGANTTNMVLGFGFDKKFTDKWRWSMDYGYSQNDGESSASGRVSFGGTTAVPAAAPTNPFGQIVMMSTVDPNLVRPELYNSLKTISWNVTSTLRGGVGDWQGYWDLGYSKNTLIGINRGFSEPATGWANVLLTGAYNPFVDTRVASPAPASFYEDYIARVSFNESTTDQYLTSLKMSGPVLRLPAGAAVLTTGMEWTRVNRGKSKYAWFYNDGLTGAPRQPIFNTYIFDDQSRDRRFTFTTSSVYGEIGVPVLAGLPLVDKLELFSSGRLDRRLTDAVRKGNNIDPNAGDPYQASTTSNVYAYGLRYDIVQGLALRASKSTGFMPPYTQYLNPPDPPPVTSTATFSVNDPLRPTSTGAPSAIVMNGTQRISGGNPDLLPETSDSTNIGVIFQHAAVPGLRLSLDYVHSVRHDSITSPSAQLMVDNEKEFPGRVTRGAPDGHPSGVGPITFLDLTYINFRQLASKSLDFSADQTLENIFGGRLTLSAAVAKNLSFKVQSTLTQPPVEQIRSLNSGFSRQIVWNGNGQLSWDGQHWTFGWSARYYDYVLVSLSNRLLQGSDRAPRQFEHDAFLGYRMLKTENGRGWQSLLSGTAATLGVKNVFNREPRFWAADSSRGVAPYDSVAGRTIWLQVRKDF